jgi:hypothetical protein
MQEASPIIWSMLRISCVFSCGRTPHICQRNLALCRPRILPSQHAAKCGVSSEALSLPSLYVSACRTCFPSAAPEKIQQIAKVGWTFNSSIQVIHVDRCEDCDVAALSAIPAGQRQQIASSLIVSLLLFFTYERKSSVSSRRLSKSRPCELVVILFVPRFCTFVLSFSPTVQNGFHHSQHRRACFSCRLHFLVHWAVHPGR